MFSQSKGLYQKPPLGGEVPIEATHPNHVWTYDFVHDRTENDHPLRILTVEDEYTREGLATEVGRSLPASRVKEVIEALIRDRGAPEYVRSDNDPELIAVELTEWLMNQSVKTHHIDPRSPWQNAYGESFNSILRRECLNRELFHSVLEARVKTNRWRHRYNTKRPHSGLGFLTPEEFPDGVRIPLLETGSRRLIDGDVSYGRTGSNRSTKSQISTCMWYKLRGHANTTLDLAILLCIRPCYGGPEG